MTIREAVELVLQASTHGPALRHLCTGYGSAGSYC
jgi:hypothetical protein